MVKYKPLKVGEKRRAQIIEVAISMLSTRGLAGTSFQKIADSLDVSQSAVIHHFKNKMDLFKAVLVHIVTKNHLMVNESLTPTNSELENLKNHCLKNLEWLVENPSEAKLILYLYQQGAINDHIAPLTKEVIKAGRVRVIEQLRSAQTKGEISSSVDVELWGQLIHEFLAGALILGLSEKGSFEQSDIIQFKEKLDKLINSLQ